MIVASGTSWKNLGRGPSGQSGQAVLEYVLLLLIVVSITLGFLYQLNTAFQSFAKSYFGDYLTCLLEAGELPSTGKGNGICANSYKPFSFSQGRPLVNPYAGGSGGSGGGGGPGFGGPGSGQDGRGGSADGALGRRGIADNGNGSRGTGEGAGSGGGRIPVGGSGGNGFLKLGNSDGGASSQAARKIPLGAEAEASGGSGDGRSLFRASNPGATSGRADAVDERMGRLRYIPMSEENKRETVVAGGLGAITDSGNGKTRGARIPLVMPGPKQNKETTDEAGFQLNLPNFIRYILIAAIVIVLVLLIGGQALSIQKGTEKG